MEVRRKVFETDAGIRAPRGEGCVDESEWL